MPLAFGTARAAGAKTLFGVLGFACRSSERSSIRAIFSQALPSPLAASGAGKGDRRPAGAGRPLSERSPIPMDLVSAGAVAEVRRPHLRVPVTLEGSLAEPHAESLNLELRMFAR